MIRANFSDRFAYLSWFMYALVMMYPLLESPDSFNNVRQKIFLDFIWYKFIYLFYVLAMITVFTPTYNRAYIIRKLYKALCGQINKNFEWLVVDDGSTDNTEFLIKDFVAENKIKIKVY